MISYGTYINYIRNSLLYVRLRYALILALMTLAYPIGIAFSEETKEVTLYNEDQEKLDEEISEDISPEKKFLDIKLSSPDNVQEWNQKSLERIKQGISIQYPNLKQAKPSLIKETNDIYIIRERPPEEKGSFITVSSSNEAENTISSNKKLQEAYRAVQLGHETIAVKWFSEILEQDEENFSALFGLARTYHRSRQLDQAKYVYGRILELYPNHEQTLNNLIVLVTEQSPKYAIDQLESIEAANPHYSQVFVQKGLIYLKMNEYESASKEFINAVKLSPSNYNYQYNLALAYDRMGKTHVALYLYDRILQAHRQGKELLGDIKALRKRYLYLKNKLTYRKEEHNGIKRAS